MRAISRSVPNSSVPSTQAYSPSVPITVYRDLAAELQAAQAMVDALSVKNQQLTQENQQLRQEITKAVQSFVHLQKLVDSYATPSYNQFPHSSPDFRSETNPPTQPVRPPKRVSGVPPVVTPKMVEFPSSTSQPIYFEEQEVSYYTTGQSESKEFKTWWLIIAILLIIFTAFGAGYLIVRPLFEQQSR